MRAKGDLDVELAARVRPKHLRSLAASKGWTRLDLRGGKWAIFARPEDDLAQVLVPHSPSLSDYGRRVAEAVTTIAEFARMEPEQLLRDLLLEPSSDVLRFRIQSRETASGSLPLTFGAQVLDGVRRALLAAACSVVEPQPFHPRLSRSEAVSLVQRSRLGPSEKGSYIVTLACPLEGESEDEEQASLFNTQPTPFARRALSGLLRAVGTIALAAERDELDKAVEDAAEAKGSPLSANLCEALLLLRPEDDTGTVDLSVSWALTLACNEDIPQSIRLQRDTFDAIQSVARALRPAQDTETSLFVGTVDTLDGNPNEDDQVEGDVYLWLLCDDSTVRAKARLNADFYRRAITAHSQNHPVTVEGELVRGQRRHALRSVTSFELAGRTPKTDETTSRS